MPTSVDTLRRRGRSSETMVIIGAGQAGAQAAFTLRERGFNGKILLLGDEAQAPYQRPPLSKKFLANGLSVERLFLRPPAYYSENEIDLRLHVHVDGIDRRRARLYLGGKRAIAYDKLLLATGSRARRLDVPGSKSMDVHYLRSMQDALSLRGKLARGVRVAIVGGGYIGLEVAATAQATGASVTVFEGQERLLKRVTTPVISTFMAEVHRKSGVDIRCSTQIDRLESGERLDAVIANGARSAADVAVIGVGAEPNVELAAEAGVACNNGIAVDEYCRTSDPSIYAAGDCTNHLNPLFHARLRLESVQNAMDQGTSAAINMMGMERRYSEVPWFWSNQYQHKIQSAGLCADYDEIEQRGDMENERFALVYRKHGKLVGVDAVNLPREYMEVRKALEQERRAAAAPKRPVCDEIRACAAYLQSSN